MCPDCKWKKRKNKRKVSNLEYVVTRPYICHINPLTVNIMAISVPAPYRNALIAHVVAGEPLLDSYDTFTCRSTMLSI